MQKAVRGKSPFSDSSAMLAKTKSFISVVASWEGEPPAVPYAYYNKHADSAHVSRLSYFLQTNMIRSDDQKQKPAAELNVLPALPVAQFRTTDCTV